MGLHDDVSEKTLSIIAMINILNLPTPSLLHLATYLQRGSSISLLSNCLSPPSDAWHTASAVFQCKLFTFIQIMSR